MRKLLPALLLLLAPAAYSQTVPAVDCTQTGVQNAFNAVVAGTTTVTIPPCSAGVGWSGQVHLTIPVGSTTLSIIGAGSLTTLGGNDQTVIIDNFSSSSPLLVISTNSSPTAVVRLAGITFKGGSTGGTAKFDGMVQFNGPSQNVRFDHSHINLTTYSPGTNGSGIQFQGCMAGVTDHNIFDAGSVANMVRLFNGGTCNGDALGIGDRSWTIATAFGSAANYMYVETNTFNGSAGNDCTFGGRYVWRFNTMNMTIPAPSVQTHPTGGAGRIRGCRAIEIYKNVATAQPANYINNFFWSSSGPALVWGNTLPSSSAGGGTGYRTVIGLHNMRTDASTYHQTTTPNGWGYCGTAFDGIGSNWDGNTPSASVGYPCLDQPGRGAGDLLTGGFSSDGSGSNNVTNNATGCISSASCAYPRQALEPIYEWGDIYSPVPSNPSGIVGAATGVVANRDFYVGIQDNGTPITFTGATGVGSGILASRPATCTTGVAYFATDQGSWNSSGSGGQGVLYKCTSTNTWTLFYTPFTYPHPLVTGTVTAPTVPTGLAASVNGSTVNLTWTASTGSPLITYNMKRGTVSGGPYTTIATGVTTLNYADTNLAGTYFYVISATNSAGTSANSSQVSATVQQIVSIPSAPTSLSATNTGTQNVLNWTASLGTPTGYHVKRGTICTSLTVIATLGLVTSYTDSGLANGSYCYAVDAFNTAGTSPNSNQASAVVATASSANLTPSSIPFGFIVVGTTSPANPAPTVVVKSVGNTNLVLAASNAVTISGPNAADFSISTTSCTNNLSLAPNNTCNISVTFTPSLVGAETASLVVASNDPNGPDSVSLSGTGVAPVILSTTNLNFGNQFINKTSAALSVTFTNNTGSTVTFSSIALTTGTQFAISLNTCGGSVLNGAFCTISITFKPTSSGNKTDTLTFTSSAFGSPHTVSIQGNGKKHGVLKVGAVVKWRYDGAGVVRTVLRSWRRDEFLANSQI